MKKILLVKEFNEQAGSINKVKLHQKLLGILE